MRDVEIQQMQEANDKRFMVLLHRSDWEKTRRQAFEKLLRSRWTFILFLINPNYFWNAVDRVQRSMLEECARQMEEAAGKQQIIKPVILTGNGHG